MYKAIVLPLAKKDIREAALWYEEKQTGLGKRFTQEVRGTVLFVTKTPKASNIRYDNIRTAVLRVFPFIIHYTIDEDNKTVIVSSVLHTSRNPEIWEDR